MQMSEHAEKRARQRGIQMRLVQLVLDEGAPLSRNPDRLLLGKRQLRRLREEGRVDSSLLDSAQKAGPLACVVRGDRIITVFRATKTVNRSRRGRPGPGRRRARGHRARGASR